jgi:hypothetical protein
VRPGLDPIRVHPAALDRIEADSRRPTADRLNDWGSGVVPICPRMIKRDGLENACKLRVPAE